MKSDFVVAQSRTRQPLPSKPFSWKHIPTRHPAHSRIEWSLRKQTEHHLFPESQFPTAWRHIRRITMLYSSSSEEGNINEGFVGSAPVASPTELRRSLILDFAASVKTFVPSWQIPEAAAWICFLNVGALNDLDPVKALLTVACLGIPAEGSERSRRMGLMGVAHLCWGFIPRSLSD